MSTSGFNTDLQEVASFVLEEWAMMLIDPCEEGLSAFAAPDSVFCARAEYSGVFNGELLIIAEPNFVDKLTQNLLGEDHSVTEEQRADSFKELANVISGNFLVKAFGEETVFELPKFKVEHTSIKEIPELLTSTPVFCRGDGEPLLVSFAIKAE